MRLAAILAVLVHAAIARAESPYVASAGVGLAFGQLELDEPGPAAAQLGAGVHVDVLGRVLPELGIGLHVALSRTPHTTTGQSPNGTYMFYATDIGIVATYELADRVWASPWLGLEDGEMVGDYFTPTRTIAYGIEAGVDVWRDGKQRIGAFASLQHSHVSAYSNSTTFTGTVAGIAFRYW